MDGHARQIIQHWPEEAREPAQLVIEQYGEPDEISESQLIWHRPGPWKRMVATRAFYDHSFPTPHHDSVESVIDYRVPLDKVAAVTEFDGSVVVERTAGEVSARCHDEQANFLALNLVHDIVTGRKSVAEARQYYAKEFLDYRRGLPTPYMEKLHIPPPEAATTDPDEAVLSDAELEVAVQEGQRRQEGA
ncbi:MAG TPA: hypothetical protein VK035_04140 [Kiloniellales bacterium]|nr:hypothetical protein [Kiloniellales bacterium]